MFMGIPYSTPWVELIERSKTGNRSETRTYFFKEKEEEETKASFPETASPLTSKTQFLEFHP